MEWIKTKDKIFPKDGSLFLAFREDFQEIEIVCWQKGMEWEEGELLDSATFHYHPKYCSHWMPLPSAPETKH